MPLFPVALGLIALAAWAGESADRAVAEWVLRRGGSVSLEGATDQVWDVAALPDAAFRLRRVNLVGVLVEPREIQRIGELRHLRELYVTSRIQQPFSLQAKARSTATDGWVFLKNLPKLERFVISETVFSFPIPIDDAALDYLGAAEGLEELRL